MRVAALYDIHGNLPALEAVLAEVEAAAPDLVVVGGDVVAGPLPGETLDRLVALGDRVRWVMGNADRMVIEAYDRGGRPADPEDAIDRLDAWVARQLTPRAARPAGGLRAARARGRRSTSVLPRLTAQRRARSSPRSAPSERLAPILEGVAEDVVVCGHTHHQFDRACSASALLNAGSVGMPYEDERRRATGCCSAPSPSCGAPTTTSRRRSSACAPAACRAWTS